MAKTLQSFGHFECNRVKEKNLLPQEQILLIVNPILVGLLQTGKQIGNHKIMFPFVKWQKNIQVYPIQTHWKLKCLSGLTIKIFVVEIRSQPIIRLFWSVFLLVIILCPVSLTPFVQMSNKISGSILAQK